MKEPNVKKMMKICSKCKKEINIKNFYANKSRFDGLAHYCKLCSKIHREKWYHKNIIEIKKRYKEKRIPKRRITPKERFLNKIIISKNGCWEWIARKNKGGYGTFQLNKKPILAHRFSYLIFKGEFFNGLLVCHKCDNPKCVNPEHLWLGTQKENMLDCYKKGRRNKYKKYEK